MNTKLPKNHRMFLYFLMNQAKTIELNLNVDILLYKGLKYMQEAIDDALTVTTKCRQCLAMKTLSMVHIYLLIL